jgi:leukotriene-A4 hydrolase
MITYEYNQVNPIPSYLIAIVAGALAKESVGPRSSVWAEKELIAKAVHEFKEDTEKFILAGEEITGMKYEWGVYDMVVLPAAFPYGGMENPNITFLSASLLAGDRSLTNVVAHEITHSWAGNYTTNSNWGDFWLNEGFTVYIERMVSYIIR